MAQPLSAGVGTMAELTGGGTGYAARLVRRSSRPSTRW
jgi:hypothetical protein